MTWVVDTCVLIDLLKADPVFAKVYSKALRCPDHCTNHIRGIGASVSR